MGKYANGWMSMKMVVFRNRVGQYFNKSPILLDQVPAIQLLQFSLRSIILNIFA